MAKKSKTQRAKASAARAAKKEQALTDESAESNIVQEAEEAPKEKKSLFKKSEEASTPAEKKTAEKPVEKKAAKTEKVKKSRFQFLKDVRAELKRVTWPSRQDVLRWSLVVVAALVFFGLFTFVFDGLFTQVLVFISGLGA